MGSGLLESGIKIKEKGYGESHVPFFVGVIGF
jgi:hypothetical protein